MSKIIISFEYEPNLDYYPAGTETAAEAMRFDIEQVQNSNFSWDELLEGPGNLTIEVSE